MKHEKTLEKFFVRENFLKFSAHKNNVFVVSQKSQSDFLGNKKIEIIKQKTRGGYNARI